MTGFFSQSLSPAGLAFLRHEEGIRGQVYNDATGKTISSYSDPGLKLNGGTGYPTIAMGLALLTPELRAEYAPYLGGGKVLSGADMDRSIASALAPRVAQLNKMLTVKATQNQFDALFSFAYNRGFAGHGFPSAVAELNAGNPTAAAAYIAGAAAYETSPNIQGRRVREAALFSGGATGEAVAAAGTSPGAGIVVAALLAAIVWKLKNRG